MNMKKKIQRMLAWVLSVAMLVPCFSGTVLADVPQDKMLSEKELTISGSPVVHNTLWYNNGIEETEVVSGSSISYAWKAGTEIRQEETFKVVSGSSISEGKIVDAEGDELVTLETDENGKFVFDDEKADVLMYYGYDRGYEVEDADLGEKITLAVEIVNKAAAADKQDDIYRYVGVTEEVRNASGIFSSVSALTERAKYGYVEDQPDVVEDVTIKADVRFRGESYMTPDEIAEFAAGIEVIVSSEEGTELGKARLSVSGSAVTADVKISGADLKPGKQTVAVSFVDVSEMGYSWELDRTYTTIDVYEKPEITTADVKAVSHSKNKKTAKIAGVVSNYTAKEVTFSYAVATSGSAVTIDEKTGVAAIPAGLEDQVADIEVKAVLKENATVIGTKTVQLAIYKDAIPVIKADGVQFTATNAAIEWTEAGLYKGAAYQMEFATTPADASGYTVKWSSSNTKVAKVSKTGLVTFQGLYDTETVIKLVLTNKDKTAVETEVKLTVPAMKETLKSVSAAKSYTVDRYQTAEVGTVTVNYTVKEGNKNVAKFLKGTGSKLEAENGSSFGISYAVKDSSIATVDTNGKITGLKKGNTKLIVSVNNSSIKKEITLKVNDVVYTAVSGRFDKEADKDNTKFEASKDEKNQLRADVVLYRDQLSTDKRELKNVELKGVSASVYSKALGRTVIDRIDGLKVNLSGHKDNTAKAVTLTLPNKQKLVLNILIATTTPKYLTNHGYTIYKGYEAATPISFSLYGNISVKSATTSAVGFEVKKVAQDKYRNIVTVWVTANKDAKASQKVEFEFKTQDELHKGEVETANVVVPLKTKAIPNLKIEVQNLDAMAMKEFGFVRMDKSMYLYGAYEEKVSLEYSDMKPSISSSNSKYKDQDILEINERRYIKLKEGVTGAAISKVAGQKNVSYEVSYKISEVPSLGVQKTAVKVNFVKTSYKFDQSLYTASVATAKDATPDTAAVPEKKANVTVRAAVNKFYDGDVTDFISLEGTTEAVSTAGITVKNAEFDYDELVIDLEVTPEFVKANDPSWDGKSAKTIKLAKNKLQFVLKAGAELGNGKVSHSDEIIKLNAGLNVSANTAAKITVTKPEDFTQNYFNYQWTSVEVTTKTAGVDSSDLKLTEYAAEDEVKKYFAFSANDNRLYIDAKQDVEAPAVGKYPVTIIGIDANNEEFKADIIINVKPAVDVVVTAQTSGTVNPNNYETWNSKKYSQYNMAFVTVTSNIPTLPIYLLDGVVVREDTANTAGLDATNKFDVLDLGYANARVLMAKPDAVLGGKSYSLDLKVIYGDLEEGVAPKKAPKLSVNKAAAPYTLRNECNIDLTGDRTAIVRFDRDVDSNVVGKWSSIMVGKDITPSADGLELYVEKEDGTFEEYKGALQKINAISLSKADQKKYDLEHLYSESGRTYFLLKVKDDVVMKESTGKVTFQVIPQGSAATVAVQAYSVSGKPLYTKNAKGKMMPCKVNVPKAVNVTANMVFNNLPTEDYIHEEPDTFRMN